jgi:hypothetical protein
MFLLAPPMGGLARRIRRKTKRSQRKKDGETYTGWNFMHRYNSVTNLQAGDSAK